MVFPSLSAVELFALASIALLLIPGPAVLYVVARSAEQGRSAGLASVAGVHIGTFVHIVAAAVGLSALILASAVAFTAVKFAGAAYLVYLGVRKLLERPSPEESEPPRAPLRRVFVQGTVVNVLNPKTALFFLAFLPQFVDTVAAPSGRRSSYSDWSSSRSASSATRPTPCSATLPVPCSAGALPRCGASRARSTSGSAPSPPSLAVRRRRCALAELRAVRRGGSRRRPWRGFRG